MKVKTIQEIIEESFEDSRKATPFFRSLSDDAFYGYVTAMVKLQNSSLELDTFRIYDEVKNYFQNKMKEENING